MQEFSRRLALVPWISLVLLFSSAGCRSVDRVHDSGSQQSIGQLPLNYEGFELFDSEGILVYARNTTAARDIATRVDQAERLLEKKSGEKPVPMVYFAIDLDHPQRQELHSRAFQNSSKLWNMKNRAMDFSGSQGIQKESKIGSKLQETFPMVLPGLLETPNPHPPSFPDYGIALSTKKGLKDGTEQLFKTGIENMKLSKMKRILVAPIIAIVRGIFSKILSRVEDALIVGSHLRGKPEWTEDRTQALMQEILDLENIIGEMRPDRENESPSSPELNLETNPSPQIR